MNLKEYIEVLKAVNYNGRLTIYDITDGYDDTPVHGGDISEKPIKESLLTKKVECTWAGLKVIHITVR